VYYFYVYFEMSRDKKKEKKEKCEQKSSYEAKYGCECVSKASSSAMMTLIDAEIENRTEKW